MIGRDTLRAVSALALAVVVLAILLTTLTNVAVDTETRECALGLPCTLGHVGLFAVLGVAAAGLFATSEATRRSPRRVLLMMLLALWVFAALDELGQTWVEGRDPTLQDWVADMAGALLGMFAGSAVLRWLVARGRA